MMTREINQLICACVLLLTWRFVEAIETKASNTNNIGQFVGQLTSLLNQGVLQQGYPSGAVGYQSGGYPGYPPFSPERPLPPLGRPYPPPGLYRPPGPPGPPGPPLPPGGPYPPPYQQYPAGYPGQGLVPSSTSILGALSSIARYDDLRCVPRLLCEVASGTRPGSYGYPSYSQESPVPFLSKDALVTLLTVLNFVDDSPLLVFGRAALLGYTARGDSRACLIAYPTCPRDPDRLVDYLNNHNGGFFRFFNQQLQQYAPQYQQYQPHYPPPYPQFPPQYPPEYPNQYPPQRPPPYPAYPQRPLRPYPGYPQPGYPQQYSAQHQRYQSRIQTQPENILEFNHYTSASTTPSSVEDPNKLTFSTYQDQLPYTDYYPSKDSKSKLVFPQKNEESYHHSSRGGKNLFFPSESPGSDLHSSNRLPFEKPITMVFPDRTGTGDLRLDVDEYGHYKTVYYASLEHRDPHASRGLRQVTFPREQTMHFPQ